MFTRHQRASASPLAATYIALISSLWLMCVADSLADEDHYGQLVIDSSESLRTGFDGIDDDAAADAEQRAGFFRTGACDPGSDCLPLSECTYVMQYQAARTCLAGDRSMSCGSTSAEPFVCCPRGRLDNGGGGSGGGIAGSVHACGKSLVAGQFYKGLGSFPFVTRIGFKNLKTGGVTYPCSGSILSKRVILTAAHCALAKADGHRLSLVRVGEYDTSVDPDCALSGFCAPSAANHLISHVIVHPDYTIGAYHHDIALVVLKTPLNYSVAAQPICLHPDRENLVVGKRSLIVGWGKMSTLNGRSPMLQYLEVPLTPWETCLKVYGPTGALDSPKSVDGQWMCAGGEGKDACQGFGGGPLVIREGGLFRQIGIMSFGSDNCGARKTPSVYTSIAHFSQWIQENSPVE